MSNQTKHTKGPWHTGTIGTKNELIVYAPNGYAVADAKTCHNKHEIGWASDNARLIAAAPELLEALRVLVDHAQEAYPHFESERGQKDIKAAMAAIAKAEGR